MPAKVSGIAVLTSSFSSTILSVIVEMPAKVSGIAVRKLEKLEAGKV
ncbi:MAG: hypothetical protein ABGX27_04165 [Desulfurobacteriaceae bacterium]